MTLRNTFRVLLLKWYITIPGLLLSLALAGATFVLAPPQFSSNAIAVLVQPKLVGKNAPTNSNPLLNFDSSLSTTALILVQALDTPEAAASLGLYPGGDSYTIKNVGDVQVGDQIVQPFVYIKSEASTPESAAGIVDGVLNMAQQDLLDRQRGLKVLSQNYVQLNDVVPPSPPQPVLGIALGATGAALLLGLIATFGCAMWSDRRSTARKARKARQDSESIEPAEAELSGTNSTANSSNGSMSSSTNGAGTKTGTKVNGTAIEPVTTVKTRDKTTDESTDKAPDKQPADHKPAGSETNGRNGSRTPALVTAPSGPVLASTPFAPDTEPSSNGTGRQ